MMEKVKNVSMLMQHLKFVAGGRTSKMVDNPDGNLDLALHGKITRVYSPDSAVKAMRDLCEWYRFYIADSELEYTITEKLMYTVITTNSIPYKYLDFSIKMCETYYQYCDVLLFEMPKFVKRAKLYENLKKTTSDERRMIEQMNAVLLPMVNYVDDKTKEAIQWTLRKIRGGEY